MSNLIESLMARLKFRKTWLLSKKQYDNKKEFLHEMMNKMDEKKINVYTEGDLMIVREHANDDPTNALIAQRLKAAKGSKLD